MECTRCQKEMKIAKLGAVGKYCLNCWKELMQTVGLSKNEGQSVEELENGEKL